MVEPQPFQRSDGVLARRGVFLPSFLQCDHPLDDGPGDTRPGVKDMTTTTNPVKVLAPGAVRASIGDTRQEYLRDDAKRIAEPANTAAWHWDALAPRRLVDAVTKASRTAQGGCERFDFGPQRHSASLFGCFGDQKNLTSLTVS
ncbi:unnamed protein product [Prorocentrum cordatum]|uniref:Uncharacterized protein n=1 Tax=Prorocentrum cordatum TaxID=2364126 RepID=A0ABN9UC24_9DINO|nr:unnamed protein product [Polarella glacialis]